LVTSVEPGSLPLAGIRVIEFCEVASGPFCGMLLADMGADLIKVERETVGDSMRAWPPLTQGFSENFAALNRNKRSIALDLKQPEHRAIARRLALSADVVIENYRPGVMAKNGLGYAELSKEKPSLIYCSISAYGQTGPRSQEGGFDLTIQAASGLMSVTGTAAGEPVKCGVPVADFSAGLYAAFSVTACLRKVALTGCGEHIDVSMLGATLGIAALQTSEFFGTGKDPRRLGSAHPRNAPYQAFKSKDGYFAMAAGNDRLWKSVCKVVARPDLVADPRFTTTARRAQNQDELRALLEELFETETSEVWVDAFTAAGVPASRLNNYSEILADAQVAHMKWIRDLVLPSGTETKTFISPVILSGRSLGIRRNPPLLDEHRASILATLPVELSDSAETEHIAEVGADT